MKNLPEISDVKIGNSRQVFHKLFNYNILITIWIILVLTRPAFCQWYVSQEGHLLDANPRLGSMGLNTNDRFDSILPRNNLYITGNMSGGASFQGPIPYTSPLEFQDTLGSGTLSNFRRDSFGTGSLLYPVGSPQPYVDYSRSITSTRGGSIIDTQNVYSPSITPVGASLLMPDIGGSGQISRPLSRSYTLGGNSDIPQLNVSTDSNPDLFNIQSPWEEKPLVDVEFSPQPETFPRQWQPRDESEQILSQQQINELILDEESRPPESQDSSEQETAAGLTMPSPLDYLFSEEDTLASGQPDDMGQIPAFDPLALFKPPLDETDEENIINENDEENSILNIPLSGVAPGSSGDQEITAEVPLIDISQAYQEQFDYYMKRGERLMQQRFYYQAANAFDNAAMFMPNNPRSYLGRSHALFGAGEFMSSAHYLQKAILLSPSLAETKVNIINIFVSKEEYEVQLNDLELWKTRSHQPLLMFLQGYILYNTGELEQARENLVKAVEYDPRDRAIALMLEAVNKALQK
ncbi:MAG: hypothetical protein JW860_13870 [Sedimentisphaerales bacterium]|nr:hypothetical protein [Sedimentisphaerales bacterium]